jgi:hypothetical protein
VNAPTPAPSVPFCSNDGVDFTEQDMGSSLKTPHLATAFSYYLRTLATYMYYIVSSASHVPAVVYGWNECLGTKGGDAIVSATHHHHSRHRTGARAWGGWADGTNGQVWNWTFFSWMCDATNPDSVTYVQNGAGSMYERMDLYRNDPGHTFMAPDMWHSKVKRTADRLERYHTVASVKQWLECAKEADTANPLTTVYMDQPLHLNFKSYLSQLVMDR